MDKKDSGKRGGIRAGAGRIKSGLGFSPLTGQIVAIGVFDYDKNQGVVYFQAPGENFKEFQEGNVNLQALLGKKRCWKTFERGRKNTTSLSPSTDGALTRRFWRFVRPSTKSKPLRI